MNFVFWRRPWVASHEWFAWRPILIKFAPTCGTETIRLCWLCNVWRSRYNGRWVYESLL